MEQMVFNVSCDGRKYIIHAEWQLAEGWNCSFSYMGIETITKCIAEIFHTYENVQKICFMFFKAKYYVTRQCNTSKKIHACIESQIRQ